MVAFTLTFRRLASRFIFAPGDGAEPRAAAVGAKMGVIVGLAKLCALKLCETCCRTCFGTKHMGYEGIE